jgi:hypothetical protein
MRYLLIFITALTSTFCIAQESVFLAENTLSIEQNQPAKLFYGFHQGDQLSIEVDVIKGRKIDGLEISLIESSSIFSDVKLKRIKNKIIPIAKTGIYVITFKNNARKTKIVRLKLNRITTTENKSFNSTVTWKTVYDTTYTTIQEDYIIKKDTVVHNLIDQEAKLNSQTNLNANGNNKTSIAFTLPKNTTSWSYYIGVGQESQKSFEDATQSLSGLSKTVSKIPGFGLMAAIALNIAPAISKAQGKEDVSFHITDMENGLLFWDGKPFSSLKKGKVIQDYGTLNHHDSGTFYVCLLNDNAIGGIAVTVKVTAITVVERHGKRPVKQMKVATRKIQTLEN